MSNFKEKNNHYQAPESNYDEDFAVTKSYRESLPDTQNKKEIFVDETDVPIFEVGMRNFKLPLKWENPNGEVFPLETTVTGCVNLRTKTKGINMSRIIRTFYQFKDEVFSIDLLKTILSEYKKKLEANRVRLRLSFSYPLLQESLRSSLEGYQYYPVTYEAIMDEKDTFKKFIHFHFVYSSACPCSSALSEHARKERNIYAIPHSQRSKMRLSAEIHPEHTLFIEDLHQHCVQALRTETQVMVKREDEQAFAELNGAYIKFVEDAVRLMHKQLINDERLIDFQVACAHLESLHSYDAVAALNKGIPGGFSTVIDDFGDNIK